VPQGRFRLPKAGVYGSSRCEVNMASGGVGKAVIGWLEEEARGQGCTGLHLDSGVQRERAHRFYFR